MANQMTLNTEAVAAAVNQIDIAIADIKTRNDKFLSLLDEKNQQTQGKFALIATLKGKVEEEARSLQETVDAAESIKDALRKYEGMAEEANDDGAFRD